MPTCRTRLGTGSSPRVWGAHQLIQVGYSGHRLIPTCVGSTFLIFRFHTSMAAHPHVCGEHTAVLTGCTPHIGSSPRVWGAPPVIDNEVKVKRLIPTCVGSTFGSSYRKYWYTAHPHVCGEHAVPQCEYGDFPGSSPRVWGALGGQAHTHQGRRLIPTCVGSTTVVLAMPRLQSAHPHVCGEHSTRAVTCMFLTGSSPRVWGAPNTKPGVSNRERLIPTCVGSTPIIIRALDSLSAHPHVCGEHIPPVDNRLDGRGSSPRVWGAR